MNADGPPFRVDVVVARHPHHFAGPRVALRPRNSFALPLLAGGDSDVLGHLRAASRLLAGEELPYLSIAERAHQIVAASSCGTAKVKVAAPREPVVRSTTRHAAA